MIRRSVCLFIYQLCAYVSGSTTIAQQIILLPQSLTYLLTRCICWSDYCNTVISAVCVL